MLCCAEAAVGLREVSAAATAPGGHQRVVQLLAATPLLAFDLVACCVSPLFNLQQAVQRLPCMYQVVMAHVYANDLWSYDLSHVIPI